MPFVYSCGQLTQRNDMNTFSRNAISQRCRQPSCRLPIWTLLQWEAEKKRSDNVTHPHGNAPRRSPREGKRRQGSQGCCSRQEHIGASCAGQQSIDLRRVPSAAAELRARSTFPSKHRGSWGETPFSEVILDRACLSTLRPCDVLAELPINSHARIYVRAA